MLKRLFTLFFFLILTFNTNAEIQKIVYIDIEKIMQQSVAGKNFINLLEKNIKPIFPSLKKRMNKLKKKKKINYPKKYFKSTRFSKRIIKIKR